MMNAAGLILFCVLSLQAGGVFGPAVNQVELELSSAAVEQLRASPRQWVDARASINGGAAIGIRTRLKGTGSFQPIDRKPSFTLDMREVAEDERPDGCSKLYLNNSVQDPTYAKEILATELFRKAGVPAPRIGHARVRLNGRVLGMYILKEGFGESFLRQNFPDLKGDLYEPEETRDIDAAMDPKTRFGSSGHEAIALLARAAGEPNPEKRWLIMSKLADMDRLISFIAAEVLSAHWDGYALGQNNFRVFAGAESGKVTFLPTGMDQAFANPDLSYRTGVSGLVARAVLETPEGRESYENRFRTLFEEHFKSVKMTSEVRVIASRVARHLSMSERKQLRDEADELRERIRERERFLKQELAGAESILVNEGTVPSGLWMPVDAPSDGEMLNSADALTITTRESCASSWRATVRLAAGQYQFSGNVMVHNVLPLPFGQNHGATVRVAGRSNPSHRLVGTSEPQRLATEFEVNDPEEDVVLICELRASAGTSVFAKNSLRVARVERKLQAHQQAKKHENK